MKYDNLLPNTSAIENEWRLMEQVQNTLQETDEEKQQWSRAAAGEEEQEIWSWGAGTDGQLATGWLQDEHTPKLLRSFSSSIGIVSSLSCGGAHVIAVAPGKPSTVINKHSLHVCYVNIAWLGLFAEQVEESWHGGGAILVNWATGRWLIVYNQRSSRLWKAL